MQTRAFGDLAASSLSGQSQCSSVFTWRFELGVQELGRGSVPLVCASTRSQAAPDAQSTQVSAFVHDGWRTSGGELTGTRTWP
jgi:hypothetical protein